MISLPSCKEQRKWDNRSLSKHRNRLSLLRILGLSQRQRIRRSSGSPSVPAAHSHTLRCFVKKSCSFTHCTFQWCQRWHRRTSVGLLEAAEPLKGERQQRKLHGSDWNILFNKSWTIWLTTHTVGPAIAPQCSADSWKLHFLAISHLPLQYCWLILASDRLLEI